MSPAHRPIIARGCGDWGAPPSAAGVGAVADGSGTVCVRGVFVLGTVDAGRGAGVETFSRTAVTAWARAVCRQRTTTTLHLASVCGSRSGQCICWWQGGLSNVRQRLALGVCVCV